MTNLPFFCLSLRGFRLINYNFINMSTKKLVRDIKNKKLAGVCAGVANYFGLDVTLVRIIWLVLALMGSLGLWIYLILLLVLPKAE